MLRHKHWKLICVGEREVVDRVAGDRESKRRITDPNAPWHERVVLYDLETDTAETTNVARDNSGVVAKMAGLAMDAFVDGRTTIGPARPNSCNQPQIDLLETLVAVIQEHK